MKVTARQSLALEGANQLLVGSPRRGDRGRLGAPSLPPSWGSSSKLICGPVRFPRLVFHLCSSVARILLRFLRWLLFKFSTGGNGEKSLCRLLFHQWSSVVEASSHYHEGREVDKRKRIKSHRFDTDKEDVLVRWRKSAFGRVASPRRPRTARRAIVFGTNTGVLVLAAFSGITGLLEG